MDTSIEPTTVIETSKEIRTYKYEGHVKPRLNDIYEWVKAGNTDYSIADNLGICHESLIKYKAEILELSSVYTRALHERNCLVVNAVFKRAIGYDYEETTTEADKVTKVVTKHVPGDVNAQKFHLINRDPANWQPENRIENSHIIINNFQLDDAKVKIADMLQEYNKLTALEVTDFKVVE